MTKGTMYVASTILMVAGLVAAPGAGAAVQDAGPRGAAGVGTAEGLRSAISRSDGVVRFEFDAKPGVWGNGRSWNFSSPEDGPTTWHCDGCTNGPVRVSVRVDGGRATDLESQVGGRWKSEGRDLGHVDARIAVDYLLGFVEGGEADDESREEALQAAVAAPVDDIWRRLLAIARDRSEEVDVRKAALFWTAHEAGAQAASDIEEIAVASEDETDVQEAAVFALTQLPEERGTDALLRLARQNRNPEIVRSVYFWLGQRDDARVIALFEEILLD